MRRDPGDGVLIVAGEALFDLVRSGSSDDLRGHPGGGPFNTARTIGRLGQPVAYLGRLSTDGFGQRLERLLAGDGVALDSVVRTHDPTTLALVEVGVAGVAAYRFYARGTAAAGLTVDAALAALPAAVDVVHVGTLGLVLEPVAAALEAVVARVAGGALVAVDANVRPWAIEDPVAYRARLRRVLSDSHLIKVSEEDVGWLDPGVPPVQSVRGLLEHGPTVGLLTRGPGGAVVVTPDAEVAVPAPRVKVVDTIGAGDAFGGGFLAWWRERGLGREDLGQLELAVEATAFACLVAARTCARPGAAPPHRSELEYVI
jgi:fructokinase